MSKLYAELKSDKGGRVASKGGNEYVTCTVRDGNCEVLTIQYNRENNELYIDNDTENMLITLNGEQLT